MARHGWALVLVGALGCGDDSTGAVAAALASAPPVSGGTLVALADGHTVVAARPDDDAVYVVDLARASARRVAVAPGDEPGRLAVDAAGLVHVALRRGGAVVDVDPVAAAVVGRRAVCPAPRGITYDAGHDALLVACAGGELVALSPAGDDATVLARLDDDLRDVVVDGGRLLVSRFRSAEVLAVEGGVVVQRFAPPAFSAASVRDGATFTPTVAWRMIAAPFAVARALVVHQRAVAAPIPLHADVAAGVTTVTTGGNPYGGAPESVDAVDTRILHEAVTPLLDDGAAPTPMPPLVGAVLPVDVALSPSGEIAVAAAGSNAVLRFSLADYAVDGDRAVRHAPLPTLPVAVAFLPNGHLVAQTTDPPLVLDLDGSGAGVVLGPANAPAGFELFHRSAGASELACASCHAEGGDDGHVWHFRDRPPRDLARVDEGQGADLPRRTQSLRGGLLATAPFHWDGSMPAIGAIVHEVWERRMGGDTLDPDEIDALAGYLDGLPTLPRDTASLDAAAVARGAAIFHDPSVGCTACHVGPHLTDNRTVDVGTGGPFQVPTLRGVAARGPWLHTGCAPSLRDRFGPCGGGDRHGHTSQLSASQIDDLVAYLSTL